MGGCYKIKIFKIKFFKIKIFFRRKATPSIDKSGAKPPIFSQSQKKKAFFLILTLILTENAGLSPAFIYETEGFVLKRFIFFNVKKRAATRGRPYEKNPLNKNMDV